MLSRHALAALAFGTLFVAAPAMAQVRAAVPPRIQQPVRDVQNLELHQPSNFEMMARLNEMTERLDQLTAQLEELGNRIASLNANVGSVASNLGEFRSVEQEHYLLTATAALATCALTYLHHHQSRPPGTHPFLQGYCDYRMLPHDSEGGLYVLPE